MRPIAQSIKETKSRLALCQRPDLSSQYADEIENRRAIGGTETLARLAGRLGLEDDEIGASIREMFPEHFDTKA